jgi:AraC-like DNA-binding protein
MRRARDIPAAVIALRISVAESFGANRQEILKEANIPSEALTNPKARVTVEQTMDVWTAIVKQIGSHDIGLECGLRTRFQTMGILGYVMMNSSSIISAWIKLCAYQELVMSIMFQTIRTEQDRVILQGKMQEKWQKEFRYTVDFAYASIMTLIKNCSPKEIHPLEVGFNFPEPKNIDRYREIFGPAIIKFSCEHPFIIFNKSDMENEIIGMDPGLFDHFEILLEETANEHDKINTNTRAVKKSILDRLKAEIPKAEEVARELAMSVRSLQESLKKEGTTYQEILNSVRKEIAIKQLTKSYNTVTDVAFLTGFSDISVFSRNFKKWTGFTPTEFQNQK